jgi:hypothetical protein
MGFAGDFSADQDILGRRENLAGHVARGVANQAFIQNRIGNRVADFVRVALSHRLRREENFFFRHENTSYFLRASIETKNTSHRVEGLNLVALLFSHRYGMWDSVSGQALTSFEELLALYSVLNGGRFLMQDFSSRALY